MDPLVQVLKEGVDGKAVEVDEDMFAAFEHSSDGEEEGSSVLDGELEESFLDSALFSDQKAFASGFSQGQDASKNTHTETGFKMGLQNGFEIGQEMGYYYGNALLWVHLYLQGHIELTSRQRKTLKQMVFLLRERLDLDAKNIHLQDQVERVRAKFKVLCKQLGKFGEHEFVKADVPEDGIVF